MKKIFVLTIFLILTFTLDAKIIPEKLTCEYLKDPQVIDVPNPRLSWINVAAENVKANGVHLDTGIFGTQFFFEVLAENGQRIGAAKGIR